jgi:hypothetical protein
VDDLERLMGQQLDDLDIWPGQEEFFVPFDDEDMVVDGYASRYSVTIGILMAASLFRAKLTVVALIFLCGSPRNESLIEHVYTRSNW